MAACTKAPNLCLVTELLATTLFDLLHNSDVVLSWKLVLQIAVDAAKGLSYLHLNKGGAILHKDIKSNNILLDSGRRAKVCDFGLAKTKGLSKNAGQAGETCTQRLLERQCGVCFFVDSFIHFAALFFRNLN
jgi:serine/threonine protein kinase